MSKESFYRVLESGIDLTAEWEEWQATVKAHGGTIVWQSEPKEPPPPAVCTCPPDWLENWAIPQDFDKPGFWHKAKCPFYVPF